MSLFQSFISKIKQNSSSIDQKTFDWMAHLINQYQLSCILIVFCLLLGSCGIETPQTESVAKLDETEFVEILTEIHLLEAAYRTSEIKRDTFLKYSAEEIYEVIYEKHGISRADFIETMEYYTFYPQKFKEIYHQVEQKIEKL